ncbi:MAG: NYN domain-containing protein [Acidimicrobiia bacterium]|nr:NYN domain-containing protein [Acidimicrobiia bacterium]
MDEEQRIALFLDYENLAIGARDNLGGQFDFKPIADALAERGRVVVRRAYADWSYFDEDRRMLTRSHVELIEIPQRMGTTRKNAADIKLAVDAIELGFERDYLTTFVICTGDSDFTPLVYKLREMNKRVIGVGVKDSTSALLPPACDEFIFYDTLEGVEVTEQVRGRRRRRGEGAPSVETTTEVTEPAPAPDPEPGVDDLAIVIAQTVAGLASAADGSVLASSVKRALLRKDPTFNQADYGFRAFGEMLSHLADRGVVELSEGPAKGDPEVSLPTRTGGEDEAFALLRSVVTDLEGRNGSPLLSGLKNQLRKRLPDFSEKKFGYRGFLQFVKAAQTQGLVTLVWDDEAEDYYVGAGTGS